MPHWFGMRPNLRTPSGSATSPHARLIWTAGTLVLTPWMAEAWVPLLNALIGGVVPGGYALASVTPDGVEPSTRLSSRSAWTWTEVPSSRLIVGSSRSRMLLLDSVLSHGGTLIVADVLQPSDVGHGEPPKPGSGNPRLKFFCHSVRSRKYPSSSRSFQRLRRLFPARAAPAWSARASGVLGAASATPSFLSSPGWPPPGVPPPPIPPPVGPGPICALAAGAPAAVRRGTTPSEPNVPNGLVEPK